MTSRLNYVADDAEDLVVDEALAKFNGEQPPPKRSGRTSIMATATPITFDDTWGDFDIDDDKTSSSSVNTSGEASGPTQTASTQQGTNSHRPSSALKLPRSMAKQEPQGRSDEDDDENVLTLDDSMLPSPSGLRPLKSGFGPHTSSKSNANAPSTSIHDDRPMPEMRYDSYHTVESPTEYQLFQRLKNLATLVKIITGLQVIFAGIALVALRTNGSLKDSNYFAIVGIPLAAIGFYGAHKMHRMIHLAYTLLFAVETTVYLLIGIYGLTAATDTSPLFSLTLLLGAMYFLYMFWKLMPVNGMDAFAQFRTPSTDMLDAI